MGWIVVYSSLMKERAEEEYERLKKAGFSVRFGETDHGKYVVFQLVKEAPPSEMKGWFW